MLSDRRQRELLEAAVAVLRKIGSDLQTLEQTSVRLADLVAGFKRIECHLEVLTKALCPIKEKEYADSPKDSADDKETVGEPRLGIRIIAQTADMDAKEHRAKYKREYALQSRMLKAQMYLLGATLLAFGAAAYYGCVASGQLNTMNQTLVETHAQTVAQARALLAIDGNPFRLESDQVAIRFINRGRTPAKILRIIVTLKQEIVGKVSFKQNTMTPNATVAVGEPYVLGVWTPRRPPISVSENGNYVTGSALAID